MFGFALRHRQLIFDNAAGQVTKYEVKLVLLLNLNSRLQRFVTRQKRVQNSLIQFKLVIAGISLKLRT